MYHRCPSSAYLWHGSNINFLSQHFCFKYKYRCSDVQPNILFNLYFTKYIKLSCGVVITNISRTKNTRRRFCCHWVILCESVCKCLQKARDKSRSYCLQCSYSVSPYLLFSVVSWKPWIQLLSLYSLHRYLLSGSSRIRHNIWRIPCKGLLKIKFMVVFSHAN